MSGERSGRLERFEDRLRDWGRRPSTMPPGAASARIRLRIGAGRPGVRRAWSLACAVAIVMAVFGSWIVDERAGRVPSPLAAHEAIALPDNVVLWWLDAETPVYFVIRPAQPGEGGR